MEDWMNSAEEILNKIALEVVMLEPEDIIKLGVILNLFDELAGVFEGADRHTFAGFAKGLKTIGEKLALEEYPEPDKGIKAIEEGISVLQETLRDKGNEAAGSERMSDYLAKCGLSDAVNTEITNEPKDEIQKQGVLDFSHDKELIEGFVMESLEHLGTIEINILSLEQDPGNIDVMNAIFRPFHTIKGVSGFLNLSEINRLAHEVETVLDDARNHKLAIDEIVTDLILDAVDLAKAMIEHVQQSYETQKIEKVDFQLDVFLDRLKEIHAGKVEESENEKLEKNKQSPLADGADVGNILLEKGLVSNKDVAEALEKQVESDKKIGEILIEQNKVGVRDVAVALRDQKKQRGDSGVTQKRAAFIKVDTQKLDNMVDMVGELVITQAMLGQDISAMANQDERVRVNLSQLGRITSEIQRISMSLRMVPIKQTFHKMIRLVRDLSKKTGKQVALEMIGEDTEVDRNMVDEIYDPLVHMVRNAVDHGIEDPDVRVAAGKAESGTVRLKAYHKGGNIVVEISEDGKGLDRKKILKKAFDRNLITSREDLSDQDVYGLIFEPGFSTAEKISDVSGRGVGMDVVKGAVEKMCGKIEIDSQKGQGTRVLMKLPLTLAIIDGIMVRAGDRDFIIPTVSVVESIRPPKSAYNTVAHQGEMIKIRDNLHPLIRLHDVFNFTPRHKDPWEAIVVVAESDGQRKCLLVDELVGKQEVVIKSLGEHLKNVKGMAGGAILADGRVGLIIDVAGLFEIEDTTQVLGEVTA